VGLSSKVVMSSNFDTEPRCKWVYFRPCASCGVVQCTLNIWFVPIDDAIGGFRNCSCMETYTQTIEEVPQEATPNCTRAIKRNPLASLSAREIDVVQQLVDGHSTDAAAAALYISRHTVRTHVKNISRKLDTHSSLELVSLAVEFGMRPSRLIA